MTESSSPGAQTEPTDEQIHVLWMKHGPRMVGEERSGSIIGFARAVLALRPQEASEESAEPNERRRDLPVAFEELVEHACEEGCGICDVLIARIRAALAEPSPVAQPVPASPTADASVLQGVHELIVEAYNHWDADREMKVGKILMALVGFNKKYDPRADAFRAAIDSLAGQAPSAEREQS